MRDQPHRAHQVVDSFFIRESSHVKHRCADCPLFIGQDLLKMRQDFETARIPPMLNELIANKLAGCQEEINALVVRAKPSMNGSLCRQSGPTSKPRIALRRHRPPELSTLA